METQENQETMEPQETVYGFGTIIYSGEEWTGFANLYNKISEESGGNAHLDPNDTEFGRLPALVAVEKYAKSEFEEMTKDKESKPVDWKDIQSLLKLIDEGYPICMFKCD